VIAIAQKTPIAEPAVPRLPRRSLQNLLAPLHDARKKRRRLLAATIGEFQHGADRYGLPRFILNGPRSGGDPIRLGIFAGIHGDEPAGVLALVRFLGDLANHPELAAGYHIYGYPACNPTGFEDNTRHSRSGKDLNREFWHASDEPEVYLLEQELWTHQFHGIISLHSDDTSEGLYGFFHGPDLSKDLLEPALWAAEHHLHRNTRPVIDGFHARRGLIDGGYSGILSAPAEQQPAPFQLTFETPQLAPLHLQVEADMAALHSILTEYRAVLSVAQNI
jgi:murein peptide amidase A